MGRHRQLRSVHRRPAKRRRPPALRSQAWIPAVAAIGLLAGACSDDGATTGPQPGGAVPGPEVSIFTAGTFDDIRLPRGATEISEKTERDGAIAQSFALEATSPVQTMEFFSRTLPEDGWALLDEPESTGTDSIAGSWARDGRRLDVSALLAQGLEDERTQFSIVLLPSLADAGSIEGG